MNLTSPIYLPVMVLVLWTLLMLAWLAITRLPAMRSKGIELTQVVGSRGADLEGVLPDRVNWKSHNYSHLLEQPTLFYVTAIVLGILGAGDGVNLSLAWTYVILRIAHSLVQALWNRVVVRFALFGLSTLALLMLAINAVLLVT
jgi:hypothetical protein